MVEPYGCRHCGLTRRSHAQRWTSKDGIGWHIWQAPFDRQILRRMKIRREYALIRKGGKL